MFKTTTIAGAAALALGTCLLLAPLIGLMPNATLAAVVIEALLRVSRRALRGKTERLIALAAFAALALMAGSMLVTRTR